MTSPLARCAPTRPLVLPVISPVAERLDMVEQASTFAPCAETDDVTNSPATAEHIATKRENRPSMMSSLTFMSTKNRL
jgi:hypothetical protein